MASQSRYGDIGVEPDRPPVTESPRPKTPPWVWVLGVVIAFAALSMLASMLIPFLTGGMDSGPGGPGGPGGQGGPGGPGGGHG